MLGQVKTEEKSNEITAIPKLLEILCLGCQKEIVARIIEKGAVLMHWTVETSLHWVLDVAFDEDHSRVRKDNAPETMAMLRHVALNLLKADTATKGGIKVRRKRAGWSHDYLAQLLGAPNAYVPRRPRKGPRAALK